MSRVSGLWWDCTHGRRVRRAAPCALSEKEQQGYGKRSSHTPAGTGKKEEMKE